MVQVKILALFAFAIFLCQCIQPSTSKCGPMKSNLVNSGETRNKVLKILLGTWFTIMANKAHFNVISRIFNGRDFKDEDLDKICSKDMFDLHSDKLTGRLSLHSFAQTTIKTCDTKDILKIECSEEDRFSSARDAKTKGDLKGVKSSYNILWLTDKCLLSVSCLADGSQAWALYCTAQRISNKVKEIVFKKLQEHGLAKGKGDYLMPVYKKCNIGLGWDNLITEKNLFGPEPKKNVAKSAKDDDEVEATK